MAGGPVGDLLAAFALGGGEEQGESAVVAEDGVGEDARGDVGDRGEVDDGAAELDVQVGGDVPGLEVHVDQGGGASGGLGGERELHGGEGGAHPALGAADGDDGAAGAGDRVAAGARWRRTPADHWATAWTRLASSS